MAESTIVRYKQIEMPAHLASMVRHMNPVEEYRETLQALQASWDNLALLGQLSGTSTTMRGTRQGFQALTTSLLNQLAEETLKKTVQDMHAKAQIAIDILVRNLFERTADIGFLATDEDIRHYLGQCQQLGSNIHHEKTLRALRAALQARFAEYVAKYSVYADIILLNPEGQVLARLDEHCSVAHSHDPLIAEALSTAAAYVEVFRQVDLLPQPGPALIYAYRVENATGEPCGVLCLVFRFENEMARIFRNLQGDEDWSVCLLLEPGGRVVASSDGFHVPAGASVPPVTGRDYRIVRFGAHEYLAVSRVSNGYQGYQGPGWLGHVMLPLHHAFNKAAGTGLEGLDAQALAAVQHSPSLFGPTLRAIPAQAEHIQRNLNRAVWNGNVRQSTRKRGMNSGFSKVLLWEISNTGHRTKTVFESSIANLHETVVSALLQECRMLAALAIDIMDRNLYERANDCRWWALTSLFREVLSAGQDISPAQSAQIGSILRTINGLYTVYAHLLVFDANGRIIAVSQETAADWVGRPLGERWVRDVLALPDSQGYAVSPFAPTSYYGNQPTYIYGAAIRAVDDPQRVVGGVGIVFDASPQFTAMLRDALPHDAAGKVPEGCFGVFVDASLRVIACSDDSFRPGDALGLDPALLAAAQDNHSSLVRLGEHYYALGYRESSGYREYKGPDDPYRNPVTALVFIRLCPAHMAQTRPEPPRLAVRSDSDSENETLEIATFCVGQAWFGLRATDIIEAQDLGPLTRVPGAGPEFLGYTPYEGLPIPIYDIRELAGAQAAPEGVVQQLIILRKGQHSHFGFVVDQLGDIPEVAPQRLAAVPGMLAGGTVLGDALLDTGDPGNDQLLLVLNVERIADRLSSLVSAARHSTPTTPPAAPS